MPQWIKKNKFLINFKQFEYVIKPGYKCPDLIKRCMIQRANWKEATNHYSTSYNFKWKKSNRNLEYLLLSNLTNNRKKVKYDYNNIDC